MVEKLEEFEISPETVALFFAEIVKNILSDIDNKTVKEIVIRVMLDDDNEIS